MLERREENGWKYLLFGVLGSIFGGPIVASHGLHGVAVVLVMIVGVWVAWKLLKYAFKKPE
jgi:hypothetical protein